MLLAGSDQMSWFSWNSPGLHLLSQCPIQIVYPFALKSDPVCNNLYVTLVLSDLIKSTCS